MQDDTPNKRELRMHDGALETVDAVARAAHFWNLSIGRELSIGAYERNAVAGGLLAGLCEGLAIESPLRELVAYVYAILDNEGSQALAISRIMLIPPGPERLRCAYEKGRTQAHGIVARLVLP